MTFNRKQTTLSANKKALQCRNMLGLSLTEPMQIFNLAEHLGLDVRFLDIKSMEGIYCKADNPQILISAYRPLVRQSFTCAHEIGHHIFGDGEQFDELVEQKTDERRKSEIEFRADAFASALFMAKSVVDHAFFIREVEPATASHLVMYSIAGALGVGYSTLINHLYWTLNYFSKNRFQELLKYKLPTIRKEILGRDCSQTLIVVDEKWPENKSIDCCAGDLILVKEKFEVEGESVGVIDKIEGSRLITALQPGISRLTMSLIDKSVFIRVSRKDYVGMFKYRYLEEVSDDAITDCA